METDPVDALGEPEEPMEGITIITAMRERKTRRPIAESAGTWPMTQEEAQELIDEIHAARDGSDHPRSPTI